MAWFSDKISLGGFPDLTGAVNKFQESVKNIEKNFDNALGFDDKSESAGEASSMWPPVMSFMGNTSDEKLDSLEDSASSENPPQSEEEEKEERSGKVATEQEVLVEANKETNVTEEADQAEVAETVVLDPKDGEPESQMALEDSQGNSVQQPRDTSSLEPDEKQELAAASQESQPEPPKSEDAGSEAEEAMPEEDAGTNEVSVGNNEAVSSPVIPGADEFLPVLIYVTIKANPPQLHSNLLYVQRYRRESKLVGEAAYFFTNILSAESFISNIDAKSLSMDQAEFEKNMESARARISGLSIQSTAPPPPPRDESTVHKTQMLNPKRETTLFQSRSSDSLSGTSDILNANSEIPMKKAESVSDLENKGAARLLKDTEASKIFQEYPYLFANAGDLRIGDVEDLLNSYKQLVFKYVCLSKELGDAATTSLASSSTPPLQALSGFDTSKEPEDHTMASSDVKETDRSVDDLVRALQGVGEAVVDKVLDVKQEEYTSVLAEEQT